MHVEADRIKRRAKTRLVSDKPGHWIDQLTPLHSHIQIQSQLKMSEMMVVTWLKDFDPGLRISNI